MSETTGAHFSESILDYFPPDYVPVYGSHVAPEAFEYTAFTDRSLLSGWQVEGLDREGVPTLYRITRSTRHSSEGSFVAHMAHIEMSPGDRTTWQTMQHPYTKEDRLQGSLGSVPDWADAIAIEDAAGRKSRRTSRWGGDNIDTAMQRVEYGVVGYRVEETSIGNSLGSGGNGELQEWLSEVLKDTAVCVEVARWWGWPEPRENYFPRAWGTDRPLTWMPYPVGSGINQREWFGEVQGPRPTVTVRHSGSQLVSISGLCVFPWSDLPEQISVEVPSFAALSDGWLVIQVLDTDFAIVFPAEVTNILVKIDDDNSLVTISALPSFQREKHHRRRVAFEKSWGRWLDDEVALSDEELRQGIAQAETAIRETIEEEATR